MDHKSIHAEIEILRCTMNLLIKDKGLSHPDVLKASQDIDIKLSQYQKLIADNKEP